MSKAFSMVSRDKKDMMDAINAMTFGFSAGLSKEQQIGLEASQLANDKIKAARADYIDKNKKAPTQEFYATIQPKILSEVNTQIRDKYGNKNNGTEWDDNGVQVPPAQKAVTNPQPTAPPQNTAIRPTSEAAPNTVVSWIAQSIPNAPSYVNNMSKRDAYLWLRDNHPDKAAEFERHTINGLKR